MQDDLISLSAATCLLSPPLRASFSGGVLPGEGASGTEKEKKGKHEAR
jgi:hypothetical protein